MLRKQKSQVVRSKSTTSMPCKECGLYVDNVGSETKSVICSYCVMGMSDAPDMPKQIVPPELRRPRGWQFMAEYRSPDGILYRKGVVVDETTREKSVRSSKDVGVRNAAKSTAKKSTSPGGTDIHSKHKAKRGVARTKSRPKAATYNRTTKRKSNRST